MKRWLIEPHFTRVDGVVLGAGSALFAQGYWLLALLLLVVGVLISVAAALRGEREK